MAAASSFYALDEPTYWYRIGHKPAPGEWSEHVAHDVFSGIRDVLAVAHAESLDDLRALAWERLTELYGGELARWIEAGSTVVAAVLADCNRYAPAGAEHIKLPVS